MNVVVLGAGGVVGQHMMLCEPEGVSVTYWRRGASIPACRQADFVEGGGEALQRAFEPAPDVVVNLAGENSVDRVEADPRSFHGVNVALPSWLAVRCEHHGATLIHASTQGVFSGREPPYAPGDSMEPVNAYGSQKAAVDRRLLRTFPFCTVARLTFVVGVRPFSVGRANPAEAMLASPTQRQVADRWFSPLFAEDAALQLWKLALEPPGGAVHLGVPVRTNRCQLARLLNPKARIEEVSHDDFEGLAPRPVDTTWAEGSRWSIDLEEGARRLRDNLR